MSTTIAEAAKTIAKLQSELYVMRTQRSMLGTGPNGCKDIGLIVQFPGNTPSQHVKVNDKSAYCSVLISSKDMMALALCKAWDSMIANHERDIAQIAAKMAELAKRGL